MRTLRSTLSIPSWKQALARAIIPCYYDILLAQGVSLFALDKPEHPFTWALNEVAKRLDYQ